MITCDNSKASSWEAVCVREMRPKAKALARKIDGLRHLGWTVEDVENELLLEAVKGCRMWAAKHAGKPEAAYLMTCMVRRRYKIWNAIKTAYDRDTSQRRDLESALATVADDAIDLGDADDQKSLESTVYALRTHIPAEHFAILHLRSIGWSTADIAGAMGLDKDGAPDYQEASRQLYRIRKKCSEMLEAMGIHTFNDVFTTEKSALYAEHENKKPKFF